MIYQLFATLLDLFTVDIVMPILENLGRLFCRVMGFDGRTHVDHVWFDTFR